MRLIATSAQSHTGLLAQFGGPGFSSGPPAIFMTLFVIVFIVIIGTILFRVVGGLNEWSENNQQPVLTVPARVVTKRTALSVYSHMQGANNNFGTRSSTSYFATFEFSTGDRKEYSLSASQYGLLAENDVGQLTFQGTRFKNFAREDAAPTAGEPPVAASPEANPTGFCPYCGASVRADFKFCPHCSKPQPKQTTPA
jgi:hypothetical protein